MPDRDNKSLASQVQGHHGSHIVISQEVAGQSCTGWCVSTWRCLA